MIITYLTIICLMGILVYGFLSIREAKRKSEELLLRKKEFNESFDDRKQQNNASEETKDQTREQSNPLEPELILKRRMQLHAADRSMRLYLSMPEHIGLPETYNLSQLPIGTRLTLRSIESSGKRIVMEARAHDTKVGVFEMSADSRLARVIDSGRVSGIYYLGFEGEGAQLNPCAIIYYNTPQSRFTSKLPPLINYRVKAGRSSALMTIFPN